MRIQIHMKVVMPAVLLLAVGGCSRAPKGEANPSKAQVPGEVAPPGENPAVAAPPAGLPSEPQMVADIEKRLALLRSTFESEGTFSVEKAKFDISKTDSIVAPYRAIVCYDTREKGGEEDHYSVYNHQVNLNLRGNKWEITSRKAASGPGGRVFRDYSDFAFMTLSGKPTLCIVRSIEVQDKVFSEPIGGR